MEGDSLLANAERIWHKVETVSIFCAGLLVMAMMLLTTVDVFGRYVLNSPLPGTLEIIQSLLVGTVFLGIAYIQGVKEHITVELVFERFPKKVRLWLTILAYVVGIFTFAIFGWRGGVNAWEAWVTQDYALGLFQVPYWPSKSLVPLGCGMLIIRLIFDIFNIAGKLRSDAGGEEANG